jgi:hypothetical protein
MVGRCLQADSDVLKLNLRLIVVVGITGMSVASAVIVMQLGWSISCWNLILTTNVQVASNVILKTEMYSLVGITDQ